MNKLLVLQGEITGPGIQKNRLMLKEIDIYIFDIWFIDERRYASLSEMAKGKYTGTPNNREGIVIRPAVPVKSEELCGRLSIKVLNNDYLLKDEE